MGVQHLGDVGLKQEIGLIWRAIRRISKATLQNSSIGRAVLRFYAGGRIVIEDGGGIEIIGGGYIVMDGDITGDGDFDWTGTLKARGPWELIGLGKVTAAVVEWTGRLDLTGDIVVLAGGTIKAGNIEITPSANGGTIKVGAHSIYVNGAAMTILHSSGSQFVLNSSGATMSAGSRLLSVQDGGFFVSGLPTIASGAAGGLPSGALWTDGSSLYRVA